MKFHEWLETKGYYPWGVRKDITDISDYERPADISVEGIFNQIKKLNPNEYRLLMKKLDVYGGDIRRSA